MTTRKDLSDKEHALIDRARRELSKHAAPDSARHGNDPAAKACVVAGTTRAVEAVAPQSVPPIDLSPASTVAADSSGTVHATRIAALMAAEREETERQRRRMRRWGIYVPLAVFAIALLWLAILLLRRPWG